MTAAPDLFHGVSFLTKIMEKINPSFCTLDMVLWWFLTEIYVKKYKCNKSEYRVESICFPCVPEAM